MFTLSSIQPGVCANPEDTAILSFFSTDIFGINFLMNGGILNSNATYFLEGSSYLASLQANIVISIFIKNAQEVEDFTVMGISFYTNGSSDVTVEYYLNDILVDDETVRVLLD